MVAFELFSSVLLVSFIVSCLFFVTLTVHSLVETRREKEVMQGKALKSGKPSSRPLHFGPFEARGK